MTLDEGLVLIESRVWDGELCTHQPSIRGVATRDVPIRYIDQWKRIIKICFGVGHVIYNPLASLCARWADFLVFWEDARKLEGIDDREALLSCRYYGSRCFSPDTAVWLSRSDNACYARSTPLVLTYEGVSIAYLCAADILAAHGVVVRACHVGAGKIYHKGAKMQGFEVEAYVPPGLPLA